MDDGWSSDVIIARSEKNRLIDVVFYRRFKDNTLLDVTTLPMQVRRKSYGHKELMGNKAIKEVLTIGKKLILPAKMNVDF